MTLLAELRADIEEMLRQGSGRAVLWLDPEGQWERLLNRLGGEFELVKYDGSQLELRVAVERRPVGQKGRILYVPLPREGLTVLKEYEFLLPVWDEKLLIALRRWGVGIPREEEKAILRVLPGLAARWSDRPMETWRHLTASGIRSRLFDDGQVRAFLADPASVSEALQREGTLQEYREFLEEVFGVGLGQDASPEETAHQLVRNLMLSEAAELNAPRPSPPPRSWERTPPP